MSKNSPFTMGDLHAGKASDFKLQMIREDDVVYQATVLKRKTFLGMFERWVFESDLMDPVRAVDDEIAKAKDKLKDLEAKREAKLREAKTLMQSIPNAFEMRPFNLKKDAASKPVSDVFGGKEEKSKPKKEPRVLNGTVAGPESKQNNQRKGN